MATGILVIGESGSGKSTSVRNLVSAETYIVNVQGKPLPWKGSKEQYNSEARNMNHCDNAQKIGEILKSISERAPHISTVVIDDFQYIMVNEMMRRSKETGYTKFTEIARGIWDLINLIPNLRHGLKVVFLSHIETTSLGKEKVKTVGKMLDDQVNIEGMFTIVLKAICHNGEYLFSTKNSGMDTVKTPMGMFENDTIPNDLKIVIDCINNY
jgi:adenosyl cobinamide kinase/adenosyl cobinamide phosphate guanylyltransferase